MSKAKNDLARESYYHRDLKSHHDDLQGAWKPNSVPAGSSGAHLHPLLAAAQPPQRPN